MTRTLVITGTDTGIGKTYAACAVIHALRRSGLRVGAMKPVASGCTRIEGALVSDDALQLRNATGLDTPLEQLCPYAFEPAIAPHLAAREVGVVVDPVRLDAAHRTLAEDCDVLVVEGAGGWLVPLNDSLLFADWVSAHRWPVALVVGIRLGCLNHALLSAAAIRLQAPFAGWVANTLPPQVPEAAALIETLRDRIAEPLLGVLPPGTSTARAEAGLSVDALLRSVG